jgi:exonuclease VII small subunit
MNDRKDVDFEYPQEKSSTFEEMIELLKINRAKLNQSNSFEETTQLWEEIKKTYNQCSNVLKTVHQEISLLETQTPNDDIHDQENTTLKFSEALKKLEALTETSKTIPITQIPDLIKQMEKLKNFCFNKLNEEKLKMEEIS